MLLRTALRANAAFSTLTGLALLALPGPLARALDTGPPWLLAAVGAGLLVFAFDLVWFSRSDARLRALGRAAVAGDVAWVLGTVALAALAPGALGPAGWAAAGLVALAVAGFAAAQAVGLRRLPA